MFNLHSHNAINNTVVNIDNLDHLSINPTFFYSLGSHPWFEDISIVVLESTIKSNSNIIFIGECGLDNVHYFHSVEKQIEILIAQIELSEKLKMPIILHIVKGFNEIIKLKKELNPTQKWIIHGINNYKQIPILHQYGFYLSFGKNLIKNSKLQDCLKKIPLNKIFLETDNSDLKIENLYTFVASLKKIEITKLITQIRTNLKTVTNGKLA